jgi:hypothetical protein
MNYRFQTYISNSITGLYLALPQKKHYFFLWSENRLIDCSLALSEQHRYNIDEKKFTNNKTGR